MSAPPGVPPELADLSWELPYTFLGLDEVSGAFETSAAVVLPVPYESTTSWGSGTRRSPEYFHTVGIPLMAGRGFLMMDDASSDTVAIINERMAQDLFPNEDPINRRIAGQNFSGTWGAWTRIVGVAADTREYGLSVAGAHTIYRPAAQGLAGQSLIVSTSGEPGPLARRVSEIVGGLDADRPVDNVTTLSELRAENIAPERLNATLFAAFGLLALVIAAIGVLGVLAFAVSQRTCEFGVRMALGAERGQGVLGMVLHEGALLAGGALLVGGVTAATLSRFLVGLRYEVEAAEPAMYAGVAVILAMVALLAAYVPAKRATRVDPIEALRSE